MSLLLEKNNNFKYFKISLQSGKAIWIKLKNNHYNTMIKYVDIKNITNKVKKRKLRFKADKIKRHIINPTITNKKYEGILWFNNDPNTSGTTTGTLKKSTTSEKRKELSKKQSTDKDYRKKRKIKRKFVQKNKGTLNLTAEEINKKLKKIKRGKKIQIRKYSKYYSGIAKITHEGVSGNYLFLGGKVQNIFHVEWKIKKKNDEEKLIKKYTPITRIQIIKSGWDEEGKDFDPDQKHYTSAGATSGHNDFNKYRFFFKTRYFEISDDDIKYNFRTRFGGNGKLITADLPGGKESYILVEKPPKNAIIGSKEFMPHDEMPDPK